MPKKCDIISFCNEIEAGIAMLFGMLNVVPFFSFLKSEKELIFNNEACLPLWGKISDFRF